MSVFPDTVQAGSVADIVLDVVDETETLTAPGSTPTVQILGPEGDVVITGQSMTLEATGRYVYYHQTAATDKLGHYRVLCSVTISGRTEIGTMTFRLVK